MEPIKKSDNDRRYYAFALRIVGDFGATIAVPAVLGALLGQYLDEKFNSAPWLLIVSLVIAFTGTAIILRKKAKKYGEEYQKL